MLKTIKLPHGQEATIRASWYNVFSRTRKTKVFLRKVRDNLTRSLMCNTPDEYGHFPEWMRAAKFTAQHDGFIVTATIEHVPVAQPKTSTDVSVEMQFEKGSIQERFHTVIHQSMWWCIYSETRYAARRLYQP